MTTQERVMEHLAEARLYFPEDRIVGIFLQGSQNYGLALDTPEYHSDVDTKLIVLPTFDEIVFNKKPHSTTHVRENDEHIDFKDLRLMLSTFRKQNLNFIEILFTHHLWLNPKYETEWKRLIDAKEQIAHYSPYGAVKTMKGIAMERYHAMEHEYPSKVEVLKKYHYDPKQLHHLLRVCEFLERYIAGEPYEACLMPRNPVYLTRVKCGLYDLKTARAVADETKQKVEELAANFCATASQKVDEDVDKLLDDVQYNIMHQSMQDYFHITGDKILDNSD